MSLCGRQPQESRLSAKICREGRGHPCLFPDQLCVLCRGGGRADLPGEPAVPAETGDKLGGVLSHGTPCGNVLSPQTPACLRGPEEVTWSHSQIPLQWGPLWSRSFKLSPQEWGRPAFHGSWLCSRLLPGGVLS